MFKALISAAVLIFASAAGAMEPHGIADQCDNPAECHRWFSTLMQPDNPSVSCCGEADAFEADSFMTDEQTGGYVAIITDGLGLIPEGTRIPIPNNKIKWDQGNPTGHGIVFISATGTIYCYCPPSGF